MDLTLKLIRKTSAFLGLKRPNDKTKLHSAIMKYDNTEFGQKLVGEGADVNYYHEPLGSPLYLSCIRGKVKWVCMLLYYGADPNVPDSKTGLLPITVISSELPSKDREFLRNILSPYTIDRCLSLRTLVAAMLDETSWFREIFENVSEIVYDEEDVDFFLEHIPRLTPQHLELFIEKFRNVFHKISDDLVAKGFFARIMSHERSRHYRAFVDTFLYNPCIRKLCVTESAEIQVRVYPERPVGWCGFVPMKRSSVIAEYVKKFGGDGLFTEEEITERVLLMLSHGLGLTLFDLDAIYKCYGYCDLFEILLHMDVEDANPKYSSYCDESLIILLYRNPRLKIEDCFGDSFTLLSLLDLYNNIILKKYCSNYLETKGTCLWQEMLNKLANMPQIPSLVELSRNVARRYIVKKFRIRTSKELYTILNGLPIDKLTKDTLKLRRKLY